MKGGDGMNSFDLIWILIQMILANDDKNSDQKTKDAND